jgi:hypothetical protein
MVCVLFYDVTQRSLVVACRLSGYERCVASWEERTPEMYCVKV